MTDGRIRAGDVCIDLVERGKVFVIEQAAESVTEHQATEGYDIQSYKSHPLLDVADDETVWTCVYLPDSPTTEFSGGYDFPESRLARLPVEKARDGFRRPQERQAVALLEALFTTAHRDGVLDTVKSVANVALPNDVVSEAAELAEVDRVVAAEGDDD